MTTPTWNKIDTKDFTGTLKTAWEERQVAASVLKAKTANLEGITNKRIAKKCPKGEEARFSYRWGNFSYAFFAKEEKSTGSNGGERI